MKDQTRVEVMNELEPIVPGLIEKYLISPDEIWQTSDFIPDSQSHDFTHQIEEIQALAKDLEDDFWVVLVGDAITEEALPTYESWLLGVQGINVVDTENHWATWIKKWTGEENRHGDLLNKILYLSGRVNMRQVEISTHYLINDGFDIGIARDPYRSFVYTSFQELATYISHIRVSQLAKDKGNHLLARICKIIAGDEMRHHKAYCEFVSEIFKKDGSEMMLALEHMMRKQIVMPAHFLRESGEPKGEAFVKFAETAQRMGVYTAKDYVDILEKLLKGWEIDKITGLNDEAEKARDYLMKLPARLSKLAERKEGAKTEHYKFSWLLPVKAS